MIALDRILVPHDFTETAAAALDKARTLADIFEASCDVVHVVERAGTDAGGEPPPGVTIHYRDGVPHEEIVRYADEHRVDLIVMGTHGRRGLAHALLGSVAERVVRNARCPVLTVRQRTPDIVARNVLVATDFGVTSDVALEYGRALARLFGARLHLLHVADNYFLRPIAADPRALLASTADQVAAQLTASDRVALRAIAALEVSDSPADAIVDYAKNADIDLAVIGTHGRQAFDRFLLGSVAERVVRTAPCPVLTVHHPERDFVTVHAARQEGAGGAPPRGM
jgi:nucleotide-binding universal stress UspA family protein